MALHLLQFVPVFVLVFFRLAGMMLFAPLFGSARIPRRLKVLMSLVLAMSIARTITRPQFLPDNPWELALGIGGEMAFGLAMGMVMSFVFIAAQWGGEIIGQQMGFNLAETYDPQFGQQGSIIGDLYFQLTLVIFLSIGGHRLMIRAVRQSFDLLPLLSLGMNKSLFSLLAGLCESATVLAVQLAGPMLVTMLVVDLTLGLIGRTVPQMNVMAAGLSLRAGLGLVVVVVGLGLSAHVIESSVNSSLQKTWSGWTAPSPP